MAMKVEARRNGVCRQCATAGEEDVSDTAIGTELSAWIVDLFSGEVVSQSRVPTFFILPPKGIGGQSERKNQQFLTRSRGVLRHLPEWL